MKNYSEAHKQLWGDISLPDWNKQEFYELYLKIAFGTPSKLDWDNFSRLCMVLITLNFYRYGIPQQVNKSGMDIQEAASEALQLVYAKVPLIVLDDPGPNTFLSYINTMISNAAKNYIRDEVNSKKCQALDARIQSNEAIKVDLDTLRRMLVEAEDMVCRHVKHPDMISTCVLYRYLCRTLLRHNALLTHSELPSRLRRRIDPITQYSVVVYWLNKIITQIASEGV